MPPPPPPGSYPPQDAARQPGPGGEASAPRSKIPLVLAGLVLLALIGGAVWYLAIRDDGEATAPDLTESELERALLTEEDLGGGYAEEPAEDDTDELSPDDLDTSEECKELIERFGGDDDADETKAEREFARGELGERVSLTHEIVVPGEDSPDFEVLTDVVDDCAEVDFDDGEAVGTVRVSEGDSPAIGDRAFAMDFVIEITEPLPLEVSSQTIFWERDGLISSVQADGGLGGEPDIDLLLEMAELADGRLVELLEDAG